VTSGPSVTSLTTKEEGIFVTLLTFVTKLTISVTFPRAKRILINGRSLKELYMLTIAVKKSEIGKDRASQNCHIWPKNISPSSVLGMWKSIYDRDDCWQLRQLKTKGRNGLSLKAINNNDETS